MRWRLVGGIVGLAGLGIGLGLWQGAVFEGEAPPQLVTEEDELPALAITEEMKEIVSCAVACWDQWVVTGLEESWSEAGLFLEVRYRHPDGADAWTFRAGRGFEVLRDWAREQHECFQEAVIGAPVPECIRPLPMEAEGEVAAGLDLTKE